MSARTLLAACLLFLVAADASARQDLSSRLRPKAGTPTRVFYDALNGTLTRSRSPSIAYGPEVIYDNTCPSPFIFAMAPGDIVVDEGQLPGLDDGDLIGAGGMGCAPLYAVNGFDVMYCADQPTVDLLIQFFEIYDPCTDITGLTGPSFTLTGLPGSSMPGGACYLVTVDLTGTPMEFTMMASGDGTWDDDTSADSFGWTFEITNLSPLSMATGPAVAGAPVVLGQGCDFAVGTAYEVEDLTMSGDNGTGYMNLDEFGLMNGGVFAGCFNFGQWPSDEWGGFHLRIASAFSGCSLDPTTLTCAGDDTYPTNDPEGCPCGNTSTLGANEGCLDSSGSGGTLRWQSGSTSIEDDNLVLRAGHPASNSGLMLINTSIFPVGNAASHMFDGIACVGGGPRILPGADNGLSGDEVPNDGFRQLKSIYAASTFVGGPTFVVPSTTYYAQYWYRDVLCGPPPAPCITACTNPPMSGGSGANFTNVVTFLSEP